VAEEKAKKMPACERIRSLPPTILITGMGLGVMWCVWQKFLFFRLE